MISGGGTGGHVYPALVVVAALPPNSPVLYVGSEQGMEQDLLGPSGVAFAGVSAAPLRGRAPWTMARNLARLARGTRQAGRLLASFRPDVVLMTGGYVSVPVGLAAWRRRIPSLLYLPDIVPGLAVRFLSRLATRVVTTAPDALRHLPRGKVVVTGYPVRPAFYSAARRQARAHLGLSEEEMVILVAGGSRGARSINRAVGMALPALLPKASILHVCGREGDEDWLRERAGQLPPHLQTRYRLYPYLHEEMPLAFAAADVAICRSGASTMGELPAAGLPSVLVPYPYVHQEENADYLVRNGAALKVSDDRLRSCDGRPDAGALIEALQPILEDPALRARMAEAARRLARPGAAQAMVRQLRELVGVE